jgi:hypothetical protein
VGNSSGAWSGRNETWIVAQQCRTQMKLGCIRKPFAGFAISTLYIYQNFFGDVCDLHKHSPKTFLSSTHYTHAPEVTKN